MLQIPEEPDEATWLIPLKRFCAQIVDVLVARIQERLAEVSVRSSLNSLSDSERYANRQIVDCHVAQYHRNSSEYHVALGDLAKARAKSRRRTCLHARMLSFWSFEAGSWQCGGVELLVAHRDGWCFFFSTPILSVSL